MEHFGLVALFIGTLAVGFAFGLVIGRELGTRSETYVVMTDEQIKRICQLQTEEDEDPADRWKRGMGDED